jgi:hypothetical protein
MENQKCFNQKYFSKIDLICHTLGIYSPMDVIPNEVRNLSNYVLTG